MLPSNCLHLVYWPSVYLDYLTGSFSKRNHNLVSPFPFRCKVLVVAGGAGSVGRAGGRLKVLFRIGYSSSYPSREPTKDPLAFSALGHAGFFGFVCREEQTSKKTKLYYHCQTLTGDCKLYLRAFTFLIIASLS